jgi:hypothetical protein
MEFIGPILEQIGPIFTELLKYIKDNREEIKKLAIEIGKTFLLFKLNICLIINLLNVRKLVI